jgi:hypothetical protein
LSTLMDLRSSVVSMGSSCIEAERGPPGTSVSEGSRPPRGGEG